MTTERPGAIDLTTSVPTFGERSRATVPVPWQVAAALSAPLPQRPRGGSLHIALVGEGAYPVRPGGVSLWCHQLVEQMPEHSFTAVALTVDGTESTLWPPPPNLRRTVTIPLWAPKRLSRRRRENSAFAAAHESFLAALFPHDDADAARDASGEPGAVGRARLLEAALRDMLMAAGPATLADALVGNESLDRMTAAWQRARWAGPSHGVLTVRDAVTASERLAGMLHALTHPAIEADVIHLSMSGISALVALRSKWAFGTPIVLSEHGVYLRERYLALADDPSTQPVKVVLARFHRALNELAYSVADVLAPHSTFNRRWQIRGGADPDRIRTMYNGIDPEDFPEATSEPEQPTIVFVGRIDRLKDLHTLIRAFALVHAQLPEARLRMFGPVTADNVDYFRTCTALVTELGLDGSAVFEGRIPNTVDAYHAGHLVALTSVSEGFPFTVVESMSVGRPPVATNVGGVAEAVGEAGLVVSARDHEAVAQACLRLLGDDGLRRELGRRARERVLERFTLQRWTDAYRDVYADLAGPRTDDQSAGVTTAAAEPVGRADEHRVIVLPDTAAARALTAPPEYALDLEGEEVSA